MDKSVESVDSPCPPPFSGAVRCGKRVALGIFAKEPLPGCVKTRLCPPLAPGEAAEFARLALLDTVAAMAGAGFAPVVFYAGDEAFFRDALPGVPLVSQGEGDLGARLERALRSLLGSFQAAVLIGSDSPDLPPAIVEEAFSALGEAECVVAPSADGGYVLVGEGRHRPELFSDIPWSTAAVLEVTRRRVAAAGIACREVAGWEDVDDLPSLRRLLRRSPFSATARFAAALL